MIYLFSKIIICLILAALFGFILGWLFKKLFSKNDLKADLETCRQKYEQLEKENLDLLNKIQKLQSDKKNITKPVSATSAKSVSKAVKDDLKKISGIGKVLESRLNELGIFNFAQISAWTVNDVEKTSHQIGPFRDRIIRDNWIEQAKKLQNK